MQRNAVSFRNGVINKILVCLIGTVKWILNNLPKRRRDNLSILSAVRFFAIYSRFPNTTVV